MVRSVADVIRSLPSPALPRLPAPPYEANGSPARVGLAVESMARHMTDEGWRVFAGLEAAGWKLEGHAIGRSLVDVPSILYHDEPGTLLLQDKREWDAAARDFRCQEARFLNAAALSGRHDVFKLTILKDAHQRPEYHRKSAEEIGCHAWVVYYHPDVVHRLAPWTRREHLIRTWHCVDSQLVPPFRRKEERHGALLSGAVSGAYPLRRRLFYEASLLPKIEVLRHPGYHMNGCATPKFLNVLDRFKVAICTASMYGYALRKMVEATACGCVVVTDLPHDEVMPEIDGNLIRVDSDSTTRDVAGLLLELYRTYDEEKQRVFAERAKAFYDWREVGRRLSDDVEAARASYAVGG